MAPKKKEKNLKRSNIITLKLTDIELAVLNEAADVTGLSRSEYVRKLLLEKQINHQIEVVADMNDLRKLVRFVIPVSTMQTRKFIPSFQKQSTKESTEKNMRRKFRNMKKPEIG